MPSLGDFLTTVFSHGDLKVFDTKIRNTWYLKKGDEELRKSPDAPIRTVVTLWNVIVRDSKVASIDMLSEEEDGKPREGHRRERSSIGKSVVDRHISNSHIRTLLAALLLTDCGESRDGLVRFTAKATEGSRLWPHWLGFQTDHSEFVVDPALGVIIKVTCFEGDFISEESEIVEYWPRQLSLSPE